MKKSLILTTALLFSAILFSNSAYCQTEKGNYVIAAGSNLNFSSTSVSGHTITQLNLSFAGGHFIQDNFMLGIGLGYQYMKASSSTNTLTFGLYGRYYINNIFMGAGYYSSKQKDSDALGSVGFELGYAIFITEKISFEPSLNYMLGVGDYDGVNTFSVDFSFAYYF